MIEAIHIDARDTVATVPVAVPKATCIRVQGRHLAVVQDIPAGHKVALVPIAAGDFVYKFGTPIGKAARTICPGEHVHTHNLLDVTAALCREHNTAFRASSQQRVADHVPVQPDRQTFMGYVRTNGRCGTRNLVLVMALVGCVNGTVNRIAARTGAIPITHEMGCLEAQQGLAQTRRVLLGAACNPNVAGVLLVGLGCEQVRAEDMLGRIRDQGILCEALSVQELGGPPQAEDRGIHIIDRMMQTAALQDRVPCPLSSLVVGVQCGGSDWTTALIANPVIGVMADRIVAGGGTVLMGEVNGFSGSEHLVAARGATHEAGLAILDMVDAIRASFLRRTGQNIEDVNPTPGNKAGGITTLIEKSTGNIRKMGSSPVQGVLTLDQAVPHAGLWVMDQRTSGPDHFVTSGFAILGAHIGVFSSGRGTPAGSALMPVVKLTGNSESYRTMRTMFDMDASAVVDAATLRARGEELFSLVLDVASGTATQTERNGNIDFVIPREIRE